MSKPNALRALDPLEFRFTDPEDVAKYGDRWYPYDEGRYLRLRAREQIALEGSLGMPLVSVMNGFRSSTGLGETACAWLGVRSVNPVLAGDFDDFNPLTNMIEWRDALEGKAEPAAEGTQPEPAPELPVMPPPADPDSPMAGRSPYMTSAPMDTVVLPNLPDAV
jgi:hypothetical protein